MRSSFTLGRIRGIEIGIHYTWLFAFALIAWSLADGFFPSMYPGFGGLAYWVLGVVGALGLFGSVLIHELSHSFVALARGMGVHSITLFIFGGVSNLQGEAEEPKDEFLISVVGPLSSLLLAGVLWAIERVIAPVNTPVGAAVGYLWFVNLMLGLFNLVPGFPLDGGRVLRSVVWAATGSMRRGTEIASYAGQAFGFLLIFWGLSRIFGGEWLGGLWTAFIGWFLNSAAESTRQQQALSEQMRGIRVAQLMNAQPPLAPPTLSVQDFVFDHVLQRGERAVLATDDGRLLGLASITDAKRIPHAEWPTTPISEIMTRAPLKTVEPGTPLSSALASLADGNLHQVPVLDNGRVVGLLNRADIVRFLRMRDELRIRNGSRA